MRVLKTNHFSVHLDRTGETANKAPCVKNGSISKAHGMDLDSILARKGEIHETSPLDPCAIVRVPPTICLPCEAPMSFSIRPHRFPVYCPVSYHAGLSEGYGTIWNISLTGWRLSADRPLRLGQSFPMTVTLPNQERVFVVHWDWYLGAIRFKSLILMAWPKKNN